MQRSVYLFLVFTILLSFIPISHAVTNSESLSDIQLFPQNNIWNVPVDTLPVDPQSEIYVKTIGGSKPLALYWGGIPYNVVPGTQPKKKVSFKYASDSDNILYPMPNPDSILIENSDSPVSCTAGSGHDCHVLIVDKDNKYLYELFAVNYWPGNGSWTAGSGAHWNLSDNQLRKRGLVSADAGGLPILPGLVRYEEVKSGKIDHALRFSTPLIQKTYVWPARTSSLPYTNTIYPPSGQRFRLKASFDTSGYPPYEKTILEALKKYGMILADQGAPWYITTSTDSRWSVGSMMRNLSSVKGSDFEAVDTTSLMIQTDSAQARIIPRVTQTTIGGNKTVISKEDIDRIPNDVPFQRGNETGYLEIFKGLLKRFTILFYR
jgi:hypothetical protein